uniref:Non-structural protein NS2a protein n=1 Tax=Betacoronavirus HKU24 TaxID=1590370 RepID=A0A866W004_9BETC|nr:non-structural protein NS2a protein [Betacoronavirus HKU24]
MAVAYADKPTHFVNFPLSHFNEFVVKYNKLQAAIIESGVECKLQTCPHISIALLDLKPGDIGMVDIAIQEVIDDFSWEDAALTFCNPHVLGRFLVLDVKGCDELHEDIVDYVREKGCVAGQSRKWIAHCTIAQFCGIPPKCLPDVKHLQFNFTIPIKQSAPAYLELVALGSEKKDGFYKPLFSHWMGIRTINVPPTDHLSAIMGYCCLDKIREQLPEGSLPEQDDDAWSKLAYHYDNNLWFYRFVFKNSWYFRKTIRHRCCNCAGEFSYSSCDED